MSSESTRHKHFQFRTKLPLIFRGLAIAAGVITVFVIGIGFYLGSLRSEFRMKGLPTRLSKDVVGEVSGYERTESEGGVLKYFVKADKAVTFSDNHQEMENVFLQIFANGDEQEYDRILADKAIYVPADDGSKDFKIFFAGNVDIETRDSLSVETEQLSYDKSTEIANAEELVSFRRDTTSGKSFGAIIDIRGESVDLLKDVTIDSYASGQGGEISASSIRRASIRSERAFIEQATGKIKFERGVKIALFPENSSGTVTQPTDVSADKVVAFLVDREIRRMELTGNVDVYEKPTSASGSWTRTKADRAEAIIDSELETLKLEGQVNIETTKRSPKATTIRAGRVIYAKSGEVFELERSVEIVTTRDSEPTRILAGKAIYKQLAGEILLSNGSRVESGDDFISGNSINAELFSDNKLKFASATGDALLQRRNANRTIKVTGNELNAAFGRNGDIRSAKALGRSNVTLTPDRPNGYTRVAMVSRSGLKLGFRADGTLERLDTDGRTTIKLDAPNTSEDAANKTLAADTIKTVFRKNGKELAQAFAVGNAELNILPLRDSSKNYRTKINAPRFDCDFYSRNNARECVSTARSRLVRYPTVKGKEKQTLEADKLTAGFDEVSQDIETFRAAGKSRFSQGDRKGVAERINYTASNSVVRLRGGEPTFLDSAVRAKAREIDWNTDEDRSELRGKVSTSYFSRKRSGSPFSGEKSPVFITSNSASFDHKKETALYRGNARAWQGNNYVRAEKLFLQENEGQFYAEGRVESLLYDIERTIGGRKRKTPVFVSSKRMLYRRETRRLRYEENVDMRQSKERLVGEVANIYLDSNNDLARTVIERNVVITQPGRRASGNYAEYDVSTEIIRLRGKPARVRDSKSGSTEGKEVTVYMKENRIVGSGSTRKNRRGRTRTVYKVREGALN